MSLPVHCRHKRFLLSNVAILFPKIVASTHSIIYSVIWTWERLFEYIFLETFWKEADYLLFVCTIIKLFPLLLIFIYYICRPSFVIHFGYMYATSYSVLFWFFHFITMDVNILFSIIWVITSFYPFSSFPQFYIFLFCFHVFFGNFCHRKRLQQQSRCD